MTQVWGSYEERKDSCRMEGKQDTVPYIVDVNLTLSDIQNNRISAKKSNGGKC